MPVGVVARGFLGRGRWYDPFCPRILGILGKTKLPRTIASRSIILRMWPKKPDEKTEDFAYADDPEFSTIRRKLARWAADNVRIIKDLKPPQPPGFNNRLSANWKLLLQIAQHAGGGWPEQCGRGAAPGFQRCFDFLRLRWRHR